MPRIVNDEIRRRRALIGAIAKGQAIKLMRDKDLAEALGMSAPNYCRIKKSGFDNLDFRTFCRLAQQLEMSGREVCAAVGVPYEGGEEQ